MEWRGPWPPAYIIQRAVQVEEEAPITVWSNLNVRETMPDPLYPLAWTFWRDAAIPVVTSLVSGLPPSSSLIPYFTISPLSG